MSAGARDADADAEVPVATGLGAPALRVLTEADLPRLAELEELLFAPSAWSLSMLTEELGAQGRWYVGVDAPQGDDTPPRLVAYAGLWFDGDVGQVMTIGVDPAVQRRGLGTVLLEALVARARELGAQAVLLEVRVDNEPALALYRRHGFEVLARRRRYYQPEDVDAFTMGLPLR
ncbi:MAG: ribosomal protein S18-alanine N-acetyltransferase [Actinotalea sp.]|nr:ribosomal protein S18-alanine N-acetyltransferase [Actinotalea sp.]